MTLIRNGRAHEQTVDEHPLLETFLASNTANSVRLSPEVDLDKLAPHLAKLGTIEIEFPGFADGRGFSIARQLRKHFGYKGDLIASGPLIPDQYSFALQCGFDAVKVDPLTYESQSEADWRAALDMFHLSYQKGYEIANGPAQNIFAARTAKRAKTLAEQYKGLSAETVLERALKVDFKGEIALASSIGVDSAVLLHMVSRIDKNIPILFLETGKHFAETLAYRDWLVKNLGLTNFQNLRPDEAKLHSEDPGGTLNQTNKDACCALRKVRPLDIHIRKYKARITGRKRYQTPQRANIEILETESTDQIKLNPLAHWQAKDVTAYMHKHGLPPHPLLAFGFKSVGCEPCTTKVTDGEDPRAGRWRSLDKTECGIHFIDGKWVRTTQEPTTFGDYI
ncbi:MAG: phosphoadenylyl-sulfate reductase [Robiginitomaculum sp.]|nr:phosphoadenylyl-sulfate reductase [Robiginitomaculum sp.]